jgi:signal transduction histidine kinase
MRRKERNAAHFILLVLVTAFVLLITNVLVFTGLFAKWKEDIPFDSQTIIDNLTEDQGCYSLSEDAKAALTQDDLFAMLISQKGHILWQERLPKELEKEYTLQDVAAFTRYYLNDYPVHTYIVPEGLLVIGSQKQTTWKYTLEYNEGMVRQFIRQMPIILLINSALLIAVPLFIQRKWLRRREEERTEWIAGVSHDIRTPLTLILGNADYISQNPDDPLVTGKADAIRRQGLRIRALVANLNTSSKLDFGMGYYNKSPINVGSLIRNTVTDFLNRDSDDKYDFTLDIPDDLQNITTVANEELFRRMLENLINNSIRHNPDGCEISIRLAADRTRSNRCVLQISDNGQGTSEETLKTLNRRSINKAGKLSEHGIGLRLVKQIVKFHAWKVLFSNNDSQGFSTIIVLKKSKQ